MQKAIADLEILSDSRGSDSDGFLELYLSNRNKCNRTDPTLLKCRPSWGSTQDRVLIKHKRNLSIFKNSTLANVKITNYVPKSEGVNEVTNYEDFSEMQKEKCSLIYKIAENKLNLRRIENHIDTYKVKKNNKTLHEVCSPNF